MDVTRPVDLAEADAADGPQLEIRGVWQTYPGVQALRDVSLSLWGGEVLGLVGHNGAGKSTLMRILGGVERPTRGELVVSGEQTEFHSPQHAIDAGVVVVPQAVSIVPNLTGYDNIVLGVPVRRSAALGRMRQAMSSSELEVRVREISAQLGVEGHLSRKAGHCPPSVQRMLMIARALHRQPTVVLLDEPTAALHAAEVGRVLDAVVALRSHGIAVVFTSHRLEEVLRVSSRVIVMRNGEVVAEEASAELTQARLGGLIAGREIAADRADETNRPRDVRRPEAILRCEHLGLTPALHDVSLELVPGEVVGLAGLVGAGCRELLRVFAGLLRPTAGTVTVHGRRLSHTRRASIEAGIAYLPDDRVHNGIIPDLTVAATVTLSHDRAFRLRGWLPVLRSKREAREVAQLLDRLEVYPPGAANKKIKLLSGGNQQKALIARALISKAAVYLFDQPTEGVDIGAQSELHRRIRELARTGGAVLVTSAEANELAALCDRVLIMRDGRITTELYGESLDEDAIVHASLVGNA